MDEKFARWQFVGSLALVGVILLSFAALLGMADSCKTGFALADFRANKSAGCLDFWLNRYQSLLSGTFGLVAAGIAAYLVWKQFRAMESGRIVSLENILVQRSREMSKITELTKRFQSTANEIADLEREMDWGLPITTGRLRADFAAVDIAAKKFAECSIALSAEIVNFTGGPNLSTGGWKHTRRFRSIVKKFSESKRDALSILGELEPYDTIPPSKENIAKVEAVTRFNKIFEGALRVASSDLRDLVQSERRKIRERLLGIEEHFEF